MSRRWRVRAGAAVVEENVRTHCCEPLATAPLHADVAEEALAGRSEGGILCGLMVELYRSGSIYEAMVHAGRNFQAHSTRDGMIGTLSCHPDILISDTAVRKSS